MRRPVGPAPRAPQHPRRRSPALWLLCVAALVLAACTAEEATPIETARVGGGEVVQTVAAAAVLEPAGRVTVTAPAGGAVAELLVGDGDVVQPGTPLARLASDSIALQLAQAESAVEAAEALAGVAAGAGVDVSPLVGAFRSQLDAVFPPLIGALEGQLDAVQTAARELAAVEPPAVAVPVPGPDGVPADVEVALPAPEVDLTAFDQAVADARARLAETEAGYRRARADLASVERDAQSQAAAVAAGQEAAAAAQRQQAELALDAARARVDDLTILAPAGGVVELARASGGGDAGVPDGLDGLAGQLGGGLPDLGGLLAGGGGGGAGAATAGPVAEGVGVGAGQPLLTIFDLSGFTARVEVDEIDVVDVEVGQSVLVLVDAFPGAELRGVVSHVAIAPERSVTGGSVYPVTVELRGVPDEVRLRVGLTASAEIETRRVDGATVVPTSALLRRGGTEVVHVVRDGLVREVAVTVVAIGDDAAAVEGPVEPGEPVVTVGVETVRDGDPLRLDDP